MERTLTFRREGESRTIPMPEGIAEFLNEGDTLYVMRTTDGFALTSGDPDLDEDDRAMLRAYAEVREQYDDTLRRLAP